MKIGRRTKVIIIGVLLLAACNKTVSPTESRSQAVIGSDDRQILEDVVLKSIVGRFGTLEAMLCTGFFSGTREVTTAAHCVRGKRVEDLSTFTTASGDEYRIVSVDSQHAAADLAVLTVDRVAPRFLSQGSLRLDQEATVASYDAIGDRFVTLKQKSPLASVGGGFFTHVLDTEGGASGSPIFQFGKVVGVHLGWIGLKWNEDLDYQPQPGVESGAARVVNLGVNLQEKSTANLDLLATRVQLECKWDCSKNCCRKTPFGKVCEPVCKATCETHNEICSAADALDGLLKGLGDVSDAIKEALSAINPENWKEKIKVAMDKKVDEEIGANQDDLTKDNCIPKIGQRLQNIIAPSCSFVTVLASPAAGGTCLAYAEGIAGISVAVGCEAACELHKIKGKECEQ